MVYYSVRCILYTPPTYQEKVMITIKLTCLECKDTKTVQHSLSRAKKILARYEKGYEEPYCEYCECGMKWEVIDGLHRLQAINL